jgi:hypothetical protein
MGGVVDTLTGRSAKKAERVAADAAKKQQDLLAKQEADVTAKEEERLLRQKRKRQGRRSLLFAGTDEAGVKSGTLGE